ncbi:TMEM175 family protein [Sphaerisporangium fuscum]|uniref:TMEM175 family protein n=1 Tax=Sphaerisporangium fuscum TaxID=2835868 RepID=UPI001BDCC84E|nr:TMEM175 family protein [Sphaerisporangium fuscum]
MTHEAPVPAGFTPERVGFFTDAVFAIAMTLLVIEIPRPPETDKGFDVGDGVGKLDAALNLWRFVADQSGAFVAYLLAFFVLWIVWRAHHTVFDRIGRLSPAVVGWHFPLLLLIGFLPYPTTVLGHHSGNPFAALLYAVTVAALLLCRSVILTAVGRDGLLLPHVDVGEHDTEATLSWVVTAYWVVTIAFVWWVPYTMILWGLTAPFASVARRFVRRRIAKAAAE